jgi:Zn-finger nucleic acid-binding protein
MPPQQIGGIGLNECSQCRGLWVPGTGFDVLVNRTLETRTDADASQPAEPRVSGWNPARQNVEYRKCPDCDAFMQRRNYRKKSGVIVDTCTHGTWLDADELERIAGFLRNAGAAPLPPEDSERRRQQAIAAAALVRLQPTGRPFDTQRNSPESGVVGSLLGLLTDLLT